MQVGTTRLSHFAPWISFCLIFVSEVFVSEVFLSEILLLEIASGQAVQPQPTTHSPVLAHLGTETITQADIDFVLGRCPSPTAESSTTAPPIPELQPLSPALQAQAIELIAQQRRALKTLQTTGQAASEAEIDAAIRAGAPVEQSEWPLENITAKLCRYYDLDVRKYRDLINFRLSWPLYLNRHLTEENLRKHFERQRARFDGSRFKIDLITLAAPPGESSARLAAETKLTELRQRLQAASDKWDQLPDVSSETTQLQVVRDEWVRGWGDLLPPLVTPLLTLKAGELSPPLHTASGVHLIRYTAHERGMLEVDDARSEVRAHMLMYLLDYLARANQVSLVLAH